MTIKIKENIIQSLEDLKKITLRPEGLTIIYLL